MHLQTVLPGKHLAYCQQEQECSRHPKRMAVWLHWPSHLCSLMPHHLVHSFIHSYLLCQVAKIKSSPQVIGG